MDAIIERAGVMGESELLELAAGAALLLLTAAFLGRMIPRRPRILLTSLTSLGFWIALTSPSGATSRSTDHPVRPSDAPEAPWSPAEGPPPLPSVGVRGQAEPPFGQTKPHPAIHGGTGKASGPLFPRLDKPPTVCSPERELAECMNRHPAGSGLKRTGSLGAAKAKPQSESHVDGARSVNGPPAASSPEMPLVPTNDARVETNRHDNSSKGPSQQSGRKSNAPSFATPIAYVVQRGDSLWGIAEDMLGTDNKAKIARYWPAIHRLNRDTIGRDPNYLIPGQVLHLPNPANL